MAHYTYKEIIYLAKYRSRYWRNKCVAEALTYTKEGWGSLNYSCWNCPSYGACAALRTRMDWKNKLK